MKHRALLALALCLASPAACRRSSPNAPPSTPADTNPSPTPPTPRPDVAPAPASDALVLVPGEGIGPFALGSSRAAVAALGGGTSPDPRTVEIDGVTLLFDADAPGGVVTSVRVPLARAAGGVRVGNALVAPGATYPEVISAIGTCGAPIQNRGATITPCLDGAVKILQAGPAQELWLEVAR